MRAYLIAGSLAFACAAPLFAQERHPLIAKAMELGAASTVVSEKCKGWSLNPAVTAQLMLAVGMAGLTQQLEKIDAAEIAAMAEHSKAAFWSTDKIAEQCAAATAMTMPSPIKEGATISLFVYTAP